MYRALISIVGVIAMVFVISLVEPAECDVFNDEVVCIGDSDV